MKKNKEWPDWEMMLFMAIVAIVVVSMVNMACGIDITNNNSNASGGGQASSDSTGKDSQGDDCNVEWEYTTNAKSGIVILSIVGADRGLYAGACSDGTAVEGSFIEGAEVDPCANDNENESTFSTSCGWSETITFDS